MRPHCTRTSTKRPFRQRRRGPRSQEALSRRVVRSLPRRSSETNPGESRQESPPDEFRLQPLHVLSCNIRSLIGKIAELYHMLEVLQIHILCIQETWLDESMPNPAIPNYHIIGRRDRNASDNRGGVIVYARLDVNNIVLFHRSDCGAWCIAIQAPWRYVTGTTLLVPVSPRLSPLKQRWLR